MIDKNIRRRILRKIKLNSNDVDGWQLLNKSFKIDNRTSELERSFSLRQQDTVEDQTIKSMEIQVSKPAKIKNNQFTSESLSPSKNVDDIIIKSSPANPFIKV